MVITKTEQHFRISFKYNPRLIEAVRSLPDRRFDGAQKCWVVPVQYSDAVQKFATHYGFRFGGEEAEEKVGVLPPPPYLTAKLPLKIEPFDYQNEGIAYGLNKKRFILGDQPGLGKTLQSIGIVVGANQFPCLVICPNSLKENWKREWEKFSSKKAMILTDSTKKTFHMYWDSGMVDVFIVNIESLKKYFVQSMVKPEGGKLTLKNIKFKDNIKLFKSVILDESHRFKSHATQQSKFAKGICDGKDWIIALTGTPVINKPKDLISQLGIINRMQDFGGYQNFVKRYCNGPNEASNLRELNYVLNLNCFIRREKDKVLKDLPAKMRQTVIMDISNRREYAEAERDLIGYLKKYKEATDEQVQKSMKGEIMVRIGILKNIAARGKIKEVVEFVKDTLESGEKLILFGHLKEVIAEVKKAFPGCVSITGDDRPENRQNAVDKFQTDPKTKLIVCSIKAAGVGLTLTASSRVGFIEFPWTFADCEQCEDRAHRVGQKDSVTCYYFLGKDTIDEKIYQIIQQKKSIANAVTGTETQIEESVVDLIANIFNT